jgi:hypothetical protein
MLGTRLKKIVAEKKELNYESPVTHSVVTIVTKQPVLFYSSKSVKMQSIMLSWEY